MSRVIDEEVQAIIPDVDTTVDVTPFITAAGAIVDYVVTQDTDGILTTVTLKEIERYLAAHLYHHRDHQYGQKNTAGAGGTFQGGLAFGRRLESTYWGQTAMVLDFTGTLASLNSQNRTRGKLLWLGRPPSTQTDYPDRD